MAQFVKGGGLRATGKIRDNQRTCQALSKVVVLGGKYRLFFPLITEDGISDVLTAWMPGRKLDRKALGKGFIPVQNFEQLPNGKVIDKTGLDVYNRAARVFHKSMERSEMVMAEMNEKRNAEQLGTPIDEAALRQAINSIKVKYEGDNSDPKNPVYAELNPVVGPLVIEIATECLVVPLNADDTPNWSKSQIASVPLSDTKKTQLLSVLDDKNYVTPGDTYLEVVYSYQGTSKAAAGRAAAFQGVSKDVRLSTLDPETFEREGIPALNRLAKTAEDIGGRNYNMSSVVTPSEVISAFKSWCSKTPALFSNIDMEDDETKRYAKDILSTGVVDKYERVKETLKSLIPEDEVPAEESTEDTVAKTAAAMPTGIEALRDVAAAVGSIDAVTSDDNDNEELGSLE